MIDKKLIIKKETEEVLSKMINQFKVEVSEDSGIFNIMINSDNEASIIIGKNGETIRSLQRILEVIFYKKFNEPLEILVNVNNFWDERKNKIEELADKFANKTIKTNSPAYISNLSSYERKIIHEYISKKYPQLKTYSQGEGKSRKLVIDLN